MILTVATLYLMSELESDRVRLEADGKPAGASVIDQEAGKPDAPVANPSG